MSLEPNVYVWRLQITETMFAQCRRFGRQLQLAETLQKDHEAPLLELTMEDV